MKSQPIFDKINISALVLALAGAATPAWATIETTSPIYVGAATTINGNGGSGARYTFFSQRMVRPIAYAGIISSVQDSTLTDTNAVWTNSQFGTLGTQAYVIFTNGMMADISDTSAASQSLSLAGSLSGIASVGDSYQVRPHTTIASLFGTNNESGLQPGLTPALADNIILQIPQTLQTMTIFYLNYGSASGWYRTDGSSAANQVIYPEQGVMVRRIAAGDVTLFTSGPVKTGVTVAPIEPGYSLVGTLKSITDLTLGTLGLYTGNPATGLASGLTPALADNVLLFAPDGSPTTYFFLNSGSFQGWYDTVGNPAANVLVKAGTAFFIKRLPANGPFNWTIPAE